MTVPANLTKKWSSNHHGQAHLLAASFGEVSTHKSKISLSPMVGPECHQSLMAEAQKTWKQKISATTVIADLSLLKSVGTSGVTKEPSGNFEDFDHNASIDARTHVELLTGDNKDLFTAKLDKRSTSYIIKKTGENLYVTVVFSLLTNWCWGERYKVKGTR